MTDTETDTGSGAVPGPGGGGLGPVPMPFDATDMLWLIESRLVPGDADGLAGVRRAVRELLSDWNLNAVADDVVLVASELMANALRHGCGGSPPAVAAGGRGADDATVGGGADDGYPANGAGEASGVGEASGAGGDVHSAVLTVRHGDRDLTLFVTDPSPEAPTPQQGDPLRPTGWGLELVATLSSAWGWTPGRSVGRRRPSSIGPARVGPGKTVWATFRLGPVVR